MAMSRKERRAPVRYSLRPHECRRLSRIFLARESLTPRQVRGFAHHFGTSTKPIVAIAESLAIPIQRENAETDGSGDATLAGAEVEIGTADHGEVGEAVAPTGDGDRGAIDEALALLAEEETRLAARRRQIDEAHEKSAREVEDLLAREREDLAAERSRARSAMEQARQIRVATRDDRKLLETLRGEASQARRETERAERRARKAERIAASHRAEIKQAMARESRLVDALERSEADLAACRQGLEPDGTSE